jgi:hypothetical protein
MVYFQTKDAKFGKILECLAMEDVGKFYGISSILLPFGIFYGHLVNFVVILVYFMPFGIFYAIWYILWSFWYIFPVLVCCTKQNLATLVQAAKVVVILRGPESEPRCQL